MASINTRIVGGYHQQYLIYIQLQSTDKPTIYPSASSNKQALLFQQFQYISGLVLGNVVKSWWNIHNNYNQKN